jgi:Rps23 Pro-64 3,4-dihydroxylase Tpa1-like proline 4-hydroxylase
MINLDQFFANGYYVGKTDEIISNEEEFKKVSSTVKKLSEFDKPNIYRYRQSIEPDPSMYKDPLEYDELPERRRLIKENNLVVAQQWWEGQKLSDQSLKTMLRESSLKYLTSIYPQLTEKNVFYVDNFTLYEDNDFIKLHRDGVNPGRLCVILIYMSDLTDYMDGGGRLLIYKNDIFHGGFSFSNLENDIETKNCIEVVTPVVGNFVIFDFTKNNPFHAVEPIKNGFKRHCYINFVYNKEEMESNEK